MKKKIVLEFDSEEEFRKYELELMDRGRMVEHAIKMRFLEEVVGSEYTASEKEMIILHWMQCGGETIQDVVNVIFHNKNTTI